MNNKTYTLNSTDVLSRDSLFEALRLAYSQNKSVVIPADLLNTVRRHITGYWG